VTTFDWSQLIPPWNNLLLIPGILVAYTVHELAHNLIAYFLGDSCQAEKGRMSLNPFKHLSWFGAAAFLLFRAGWPKPLKVDTRRFKNIYLDLFLVSIAGPAANILMGVLAFGATFGLGVLLVLFGHVGPQQVQLFFFPLDEKIPLAFNFQAITMAFTTHLITANFILGIISSLPLPFLDGYTALSSLLAFLRSEKKTGKASINEMPPVPEKKVSPVRPDHRRLAEIHLNAGLEFHQLGKFDDAIARYRQALNIDSTYGPAYINAGLAYLAQGKKQDAIRSFRGGIQYSNDEKSRGEAWNQLYTLSEHAQSPENMPRTMAEQGSSPWKDSSLKPNWAQLGLGLLLILASLICIYAFLLANLPQYIM
jgi:Zn-dependent protease